MRTEKRDGMTYMESPYGAAKRQRLPFAVLRVDGRTAHPKSGNLQMEGPVSQEQAERIRKLICEIMEEE